MPSQTLRLFKYNWNYSILTLMIIFFAFSDLINSDLLVEDGIYYKAPFFDLKNPNITFGAANYVGDWRDYSLNGLSTSFTSICQAIFINSKNNPITINGTINLVIQEYNDARGSGQSSSLRILANNLYHSTNDTRLNNQTNVNLGGFFSNSNFGTAKINSLVSNDFGLPFITSGELGRENPDNQFSGLFAAMNATFAQIQATSIYNTFNSTLQVLKHFNWSLVGNIYQANTYGYNRQKSVLEYSSRFDSPKFACNALFGISGLIKIGSGSKEVKLFCQCVTEKSKISVIILWMTTLSAYATIALLKKVCPSEKWTFIITEDFQNPGNFIPQSNELAKNSLFIRNNPPVSVKDYVTECQDLASPEEKETLKTLLSYFYKIVYNCRLYPDSSSENFKTCVNNVDERGDGNCYCSFDETEIDPYASTILYVADIINAYASAISLLQNNCTFLSEKWQRDIESRSYDFRSIDFCTITSFTPTLLAFAIKNVNFTGYTGQIWFPEEILIRAIKTYYLYNPSNYLINAPLVGILNVSGAYINDSAMNFIDGVVPVSKIVPQNPDLSYAVVDVFFGLSIVYLIIAAVMFIFFIYHRKHSEIRKGAPIITLVMLVGVAGLALSQLFMSLGKTGTTCALIIYFYRLSSVLLLVGVLVKNYRIYKIFNNKSANALVLTEIKLLSAIGIVFIFYVIWLTVIVAALGFGPALKQSSKDEYYQYIVCVLPNKTWNVIIDISLQVTQIIPLIASLILAWLTRGISAEYTESGKLAAFATIVFASLIIFLPLDYTLEDESQSALLRYVVYVEYLSITIISAFTLLFAPKIYALYKHNKKSKKRDE